MQDPGSAVLSVSELNRRARLALERGLPVCWVSGELSNFTRAASGHWYFTLKDANAAVRCAMFRNRNQFIDWRPDNGVQVEVRGQVSLYEPRGEYQLTVDALRRAGQGALYEAFARLKARLEAEGLFDPARKRALPPYPSDLAVVTSPKAAALRDVLTTLRRRWPAASVTLYPTRVQGEGAAAEIAAALAAAGCHGSHQVILLVRGGGSIEDLWAFNEEAVAQAIVASPIPVVSGVGHETDFTIADFAADLRAPTPTGAAQLATPDRAELQQRLGSLQRGLTLALARRLQGLAQRVDGLVRRLRHPAERLAAQRTQVQQLTLRLARSLTNRLAWQGQRLAQARRRLDMARPQPAQLALTVQAAGERLARALGQRIERDQARISALSASLRHLNPQGVLARGYSIVRDSDGQILLDSSQVGPGSGLNLTLARGSLDATVTASHPGGTPGMPACLYTARPPNPPPTGEPDV